MAKEFVIDGTTLVTYKGKSEKVVIPDGIEKIACNCFKRCEEVKEIVIPDSVKIINGYAFYRCDNLKKITGGNGVEDIEDFLNDDCLVCDYDEFSYLNLPWFKYKKNNPIILGKVLIKDFSEQEEIVVPEGIEVISQYAFSINGREYRFNGEKQRQAGILKKVVLPNSLKKIYRGAFKNEINLESVNLPEGFEEIGNYALSNCLHIEEITMPSTLKRLGFGVFFNCRKLKKLVINSDIEGKINRNYEPNIISSNLCEGCVSLEEVILPSNIEKIGKEAFFNCQNLEKINLPKSLKEIAKDSFDGCGKLGNVSLDNDSEKFAQINGAIYSKDGKQLISYGSTTLVDTYEIVDGTEEIMPNAFKGCNCIKKLVIPNSVTKIGKGAFALMKALEEIVFPKDMEKLDRELCKGCENLKTITWPNNIKIIDDCCFDGCGIEKIDIPETVESIKDCAFKNNKLEYVVLPKTVKEIGRGIFGGAKSIVVYDTIDATAKPANAHLDIINGRVNGNIGLIGHSICGPGCNGPRGGKLHNHEIVVKSAETDTAKYVVHMPEGSKGKIYCTYTSSWGKNAEFNFNAVDNIFDDMSRDEKITYIFDRLVYREGVSEDTLNIFANYIGKQAKEITERIFKEDDVSKLDLLAEYEIVKQDNFKDRLNAAEKYNAVQCVAWLLEWQNKNMSERQNNYRI